ncbi:MAG: hypothetical protein ACJ8GN_14535 [Longimicrobiaceae bacterium]
MTSRAFALPAIGVAVLPKCPMCVMVVLGALGLQHTVHETVFAAVQVAVVLVVVALLALRRRPMQIALGAAGASAVILAAFGLAPAGVGFAGGALLVVAWMARPGAKPAPACECARPRDARAA